MPFSQEAVAQTARQDYSLLLTYGRIAPAENLSEQLQAYDNGSFTHQDFAGKYVKLIQFYEIPTQAQKAALANDGVILLSYIPKYAWIAAFPDDFDLHALQNRGVRSIIDFQKEYKLSRALLEASYPSHALVGNSDIQLNVSFFEYIDINEGIRELAERGISAKAVYTSPPTVEAIVPVNDLYTLADAPFVMHLEPIGAPPIPEYGASNRTAQRGSYISNNPSMGLMYDGTSVLIAVNEGGTVDETESLDYKGRLDRSNESGSASGHKTGVARRMAAAGNLNPDERGMADGANIQSGGINFTTAATTGVNAVNNSFGFGCNTAGTYNGSARSNDQLIRQNPNFMISYSAGNIGGSDCSYGAGAGWANTTGSPKQAKNLFAVGALSVDEGLTGFSSRGPAPDGRIKPDICAVGPGGTSHASPHFVGTWALLNDAYMDTHGGTLPNSGLLKGICLNTADDLENPYPDFKTGFGQVNARRAYNVIANDMFMTSSVDAGGNNAHSITVPANVEELRVMLYWTDYEATSGITTRAIVNDLNLTVTDPSSMLWMPWVLDPTPHADSLDKVAVRGVDTLNNVEQVTLMSPAAGTYTVNVDGFMVPQGPQEYYIIYEFIYDELTLTAPLAGESLVPNESYHIRWDSYTMGSNMVDLDYSTDGGATWTSIATGLSGRSHTWTVPAHASGAVQVRATRGALSSMSGDFTIMDVPANLNFLWACSDSLMLSWDEVPDATGYEVYKMGANYMESQGTTMETYYKFNGVTTSDSEWFSVRALGADNAMGRRTNALEKTVGDVNCSGDDVSVTAIPSHPGGYYSDCAGLAANPSIRIQNSGVGPASNFTVYYQVDGGTVQSDMIAATLPSGAAEDYDFSTATGISGAGTYTIKAWVEFAGDGNADNDTAMTTVTIYPSTVESLPYTQTFDNFSTCSTAWGCSEISCTLEEGWYNLPNDDVDNGDLIDFRTDANGTGTNSTGPPSDHTSGSGNYLYLEGSGNSGGGCTNQEAVVLSPCIDLAGTNQAELRFWYHMYGSGMGSLNVDIFANGEWHQNIMPTLEGDLGNNWLEAVVALDNYTGGIVTLRFRAMTGGGFRTDLAIDDISVESTQAPTAMFSVSPSVTCMNSIVSLVDESTGGATSWEWDISPATYTFENGTNAMSQHPQVSFSANGMYDVTLIASNANGADTLMMPAAIMIGAGAAPAIIEDMESYALCNDTANCAAQVCTLGNGWVNEINAMDDDIDWRVDEGGTPTVNTGPSMDFNPGTATGNYLYLESSNCNDQTAHLVSPCIDLSIGTNPQLMFAYHMYGINMGSLHVDLYDGSTWQMDIMPAISGDQGDMWHQATVDLSAYASVTTAKIRIRGITGPGFASDMAIDAIEISSNIDLFIGNDTTVCIGESVTFDAGSGYSSYLWSDGSTDPSLTTTMPGTYDVVVTDALGNMYRDTASIANFADPIVDLGSDLAICNGDVATLDAGMFATYMWSDGSSNQTLNVTTSGTYTLDIVDANGCTGSDEIEVVVNSTPFITLGPDQTICPGTTTTLSTGGGVFASYLWSDGSTMATLDVGMAGMYDLTVTDGNGCEGSASVNISMHSVTPVVLPADMDLCQGDMVTLDAGAGYASYLWSDGTTAQTLMVNSSGNYGVTATDANGCEQMDDVNITVNPLPPLFLGGNQSLCSGSSLTLDAGAGMTTYAWTDGSSAQTLTVTAAGNYGVTITDANGCQNTDNVMITSLNLPMVDLGNDTSICDGNTLVLNAGPGFSSYSWSDGSTGQTLSVNMGGTYDVTVTDANGCSNTDDIMVTVLALPALDLGGDVSICGNETVTFDAGPGFFNYIWSDGSNGQTLTTGSAGLVDVIVVDNNGCQNTDDAIVTVLPGHNVDLGNDTLICSNESITLDAGGGATSYMWSDGSTNQTLTTSMAGTYSVTATAANGCTATDDIEITVGAVPVITLTSDTVLCQGGSVTLDAGPNGVAYAWDLGVAIINSQTLTVSTADTYTVTVTGANGCSDMASSIVTVVSPSLDLGPNGVICTGETITLDAGSVFDTFSWNDGSTSQTLDVTTGGTYTVSASTPEGCSASGSIVLTEVAPPTVDLGADTAICAGTSIGLDAGAGFASYLWSDGSMNQMLTVMMDGTYSVTVEDNNGCSAMDDIVIAPTSITIDLGADQAICQGDMATLDAGAGYASYMWSDGSTSQTLMTNMAGTYDVTVTDANGCMAMDDVDVTVNPLPMPMITGPTEICSGDMATLDAGAGYASYMWSDGSTSQTLMVSAGGTYSVTVTDANGCMAMDDHVVVENAVPTVMLPADADLCMPETLTLDAGAGFASYSWSDGSTNQTLTVSASGTYSVTVTDANGCTGMDDIVVSVHTPPTVDLGADGLLCPDASQTLDAGAGFASYMWSDGSTNQMLMVSTPGTYDVTVTDANGCTAMDEIVLSPSASPAVMLPADADFCEGDMVTLDAGSGYSSYSWSDGSTSQTITVSTSDTYSVTATSSDGCTTMDDIVLTFHALPMVDLGSASALCDGQSTTLDAGSGFASYMWSDGSTNQMLTVTASGDYSVMVTDANGCEGTDTTNVFVAANPSVDLGGDQAACEGDSRTLDAGAGFASYLWSDGSTNQTLEVSVEGTFSVTVTDANGCTATDAAMITVAENPEPDLGPDRPLCIGSDLILDPNVPTGVAYFWSNFTTSPTLAVNTPGTYSVQVSDANGCLGRDTIEVSAGTPISVDLGNDTTIAFGANLHLNAGAGFQSYFWSDSSMQPTLIVNAAGTYSVVVTDINGCEAMDEIVVSVDANDVLCRRDPFEDNDMLSMAARLPAAGINRNALICDASDEDWFEVTITAGARNMQIVLSDLPDNYSLELYTETQQLVDASTNLGTDDEEIIANNLLAGSYYIKVFGEGGAFHPILGYSLNVKTRATAFTPLTPTTCGRDIFESNDIFADAATLPRTGVRGNAVICPAGDIDMFMVNVSASRPNIAISLTRLPANYDLEVYDAGQQLVGSSNATADDDEYLVLNGLAAGTYFIQVFGVNNAFDANTGYYMSVRSSSSAIPMPSKGTDTEATLDASLTETTLNLYPNPTQGEVFVAIESAEAQSAQLRLTDMHGKLILRESRAIRAGTTELSVPMHNLSEGIYFLHIQIGNEQFTEKVIKE